MAFLPLTAYIFVALSDNFSRRIYTLVACIIHGQALFMTYGLREHFSSGSDRADEIVSED